MALGFVWYHPGVFGEKWMDAAGRTQSQGERGPIVFAVVRAVIVSYSVYFLARGVVAYCECSWFDGAVVAAVALALVVNASVSMHDSFEGRNRVSTVINCGYGATSATIAGVVIGLIGR